MLKKQPSSLKRVRCLHRSDGAFTNCRREDIWTNMYITLINMQLAI